MTNSTTLFVGFPKLSRLSRECIITEKIDGTNSCIYIGEDGEFLVGSRSRWITPENDNFGFAKWAYGNQAELLKLGPGRHFGEWWGVGIQRGYNQIERHFSLFNTMRWADESLRPTCCRIVPVLWSGIFNTEAIDKTLDVLMGSSHAAPGYPSPEGIVVFHIAANKCFKKTFMGDGHKGKTNESYCC